MSELTKLRRQLPPMLRALAVGIPAGFLFDYLHTPIPWMIGPMIAVAALNLMGVRMYSPPYARQMGQVILGSAVSLYFTPPVVARAGGQLAGNPGGFASLSRHAANLQAPEIDIGERSQSFHLPSRHLFALA